MNRKLLFNSISGMALYLTNVVAAFILSPIIIRTLGNRDYGLWELVMSVIGYMGLLDLGIGPALVRFVAVADGKQDKEDLQQTMSTSFIFFLCIGFVATALFVFLAKFPHLIAGNSSKDITGLGFVFLLLGLNAGMLFPVQVFIATLMGVQHHSLINCTRIVLTVCRALLTVYLLARFHGRGLIALAVLEPAITVIQLLVFAGAVHFDKNLPRIAFAAVSWAKAREMMGFGIKSATMLVASRLQNQSVPIIIGNAIGLGSIVYFIMPNRLIDYARGLSLAMGFPLTSYYGAGVGRDDHEGLRRSWLDTTLVLQIFSLAMPLVIFFCGEPFLRIWIGSEYADAGRIVLYILIAGLIADSLASNAFRILTAKSKHGSCSLLWLILSIISIPAGFIGAHFWGVPGVALTTTFVTVTANLITIYMACVAMNVSLQMYLSRTFYRLLIPLGLMAASLMIMQKLVQVTGYPELILYVLCSGLLYISAVWHFTLDKEIKNHVSCRIKSLIVN